MLGDIDYVLVTHAHPDHIDPDYAEAIKRYSPDAIWYATPATKEVLANLQNIQVEVAESGKDVRFVTSQHADLTHWGTCKDHTSFVLFETILIGGDCHTLDSMHGASIFAAAINGGPWGSVKTFLDMVVTMDVRPAVVLPLHDWHWHDDARKAIYVGLGDALGKLGCVFVSLENGVPSEVQA